MTDARALTLALNGTWRGGYGTAPCPACQPERRKDQTALTLRDGSDRLLLHCKRAGCAFTDILRAAGVARGSVCQRDPRASERREAELRSLAAERDRQARRCWSETGPIAGTPAEIYLREGRGITCSMPRTLRFHPECWHGPSGTRHPALVALVEGGKGFAVHRTFLQPDGFAAADIEPRKMMLGATGGGAVRLLEAPGHLVVAEGIETALSLACGRLSRPASVWAALSASGLSNLRLPAEPGMLTIASDGDEAGALAAKALADRAEAAGWRVAVDPAPEGKDWNDLLREEGGDA